ncbi:hypothetical protein [Vibrio owensii]|uniref:hypothetical protein n=1 Tax=Vibrio owensii TaxID=696485 RepID=UPI00289578FF|nr:conserved hypothetical protein [Vibrio owensii]
MNSSQLKKAIANSPSPITLPMVRLNKDLIDFLLERNTNNIPPVKSKIQLYAGLMKSGEWLYNGDSIRVSQKGVLLDGQNRLFAASIANYELVTDLVLGLPDEVFNTIDQGRVRQKSHLVARALGGSISPNEVKTISQAVTKIIKHDHGYSQQTNLGNSAKIKLLTTPDAIQDYIENHPELIDQFQYIKNAFGSRALLTHSTILYHYHIGSRFNRQYTEIYLSKALKATGLKDGETLHHLNQMLIRVKAKTVKWSRAELDNTLIKVWNSVARSGLSSIKHTGNIKARKDESHQSFNQPSMLSIDEMIENIS